MTTSALPGAPKFRLLKVYHTPGNEVVTFVFRAEDGAFAGQTKDLYSTQANLTKRVLDRRDKALQSASEDVSGLSIALVDPLNWGDEETIEEARALIGAKGGVLVVGAPAAMVPKVAPTGD